MRIKRAALLALVLCLLGGIAQADTRVYYEIFPASFYDGDGDGKGDLSGIAQKVPYLEELGVGGVWLMPIHPSRSYHKYDVMDYFAVDPAYGDVEDLAELADALHRADMNLLLDLVINHTSSRHPWFLSATESLSIEPCGEAVCVSEPMCREHNQYVKYYHFSEEQVPGWYRAPNAPGWWYFAHFTNEMPDLNLQSEAVRAEIEAICAFWLAQGADGFRLDAVAHFMEENVEENNAFLAWLMGMLRGIKPDVYVVGEVWKDAGSIARYYESGIPSLFNFPFSGAEGAIVKAMRNRKGEGLARQAQQWQGVWGVRGDASDALFLSNHDNARIAGTLMRNTDALKLAASIYLTLPGTPFLYYGEEIGMTGSGRDENKRLPMLWGEAGGQGQCFPPPLADMKNEALGTVSGMMEDPDSLLVHYRALLSLRSEHAALRTGIIEALDLGVASVCAYRLVGETESMQVVHNLGREEVEIAIAEVDAVACFAPADNAVEYDGAVLRLPPRSTAVLRDR